jgi:hypothetical protein
VGNGKRYVKPPKRHAGVIGTSQKWTGFDQHLERAVDTFGEGAQGLAVLG